MMKRVMALFLSVAMVLSVAGQDVMAASLPMTVPEVTEESAEYEVMDSDDAVIEQAVIRLDQTLDLEGFQSEVVSKDDNDTDVYSKYVIDYKKAEGNKGSFQSAVSIFKNNAGVVEMFKNGTSKLREDFSSSDVFDSKWYVVGPDGTKTDLDADKVPEAVGNYVLEISIAPELIEATPAEVDFEIKKKTYRVTMPTNSDYQVTTGTTVGKFVEEYKETIIKKNTSENYVEDFTETGASYVITVKSDDTPLVDTDVITKGNDIRVIVSVTTEDANYEFLGFEAVVPFAEEVSTRIELENAEVIVSTYDGNPIANPEEANSGKNVVKVLAEDENGDYKTDVVIGEGEITYSWLDADGIVMSNNPVNAGTYTRLISYKDADGVYSECLGEIKVVINQAQVSLVIGDISKEFFYAEAEKEENPSYKDIQVYTGQTALEVLESISWKLSDGKLNGKTFFGTTYSGGDENNNKEHFWQPEFMVQRGIARTIETTTKVSGAVDQKETKTEDVVWVDLNLDGEIIPLHEYEVTTINGGKTTINHVIETYTYRVVPSGNKVIYGDNGLVINRVDINNQDNTANPNYKVVIDYENDAKAITPKMAELVTIDASMLLGANGAGESLENLLTKIYDAKPLYKNRAEYKIATAKLSDNKDMSQNLVYRWFTITETAPVLDDKGEKTGKEEIVSEYGTWTSYDSLPQDAGKYRLEVSYADATSKTFARENVSIYFEIKPVLIKTVPAKRNADGVLEEASTFDVYSGTPINDFYPDGYFFYNVSDKANPVQLTSSDMDGKTYYEINGEKVVFKTNVSDGVWKNVDKDYASTFTTDYYTKDYSGNTFDDKYTYKFVPSSWVYISYAHEDDPYAYGPSNNYKPYTYEKVDELDKTICDYSFDISVKKAGATRLYAELADDVIIEKTYDGKPLEFTLDQVVLRDTITDEIVTDANVSIYPTYTSASVGAGYVYIRVEADDKFAYDNILVTNYRINKRPITIVPVFKDEIAAGLPVWKYLEKISFQGAIPEDALVFADTDFIELDGELEVRNSGYFEQGRLVSDILAGYDNVLKYNVRAQDFVEEQAYVINRSNFSENHLKLLKERLYNRSWDNYEFNYGVVSVKATKHGMSSIPSANARFKLSEGRNGETVVAPISGVAYRRHYLPEYDTFVEGNLFRFEIAVPAELDGSSLTAVSYVESIEAAGGYVLPPNSTGKFDVLFRLDGLKNNPAFTISWCEGFNENIVVDAKAAKNLLEDNLYKAVAPKSLAFNAVNTKMLVGETQQLDVKMIKTLPTDTVALRYEAADASGVLSVTENGYVTALKVGSGKVKVYPYKVEIDEKNGKEKIVSLSSKPVIATITVSDVTAPKISKIKNLKDTSLTVQYSSVKDGYRREVYAFEGTVSLEEAEKKIADIKNGKLKGQNDSYVYVSKYDEGYSAVYNAAGTKLLGYDANLYGLKPDTQYTIYVRNVSAIRTLGDGKTVAASAQGSVKTVKTLKNLPHSVKIDLADSEKKAKVIYDDLFGQKIITGKLDDRTITIKASGLLPNVENKKDPTDITWYDYPLTVAQSAINQQMKFKYYVVEDIASSITKSGKNTLKIGDGFYAPSKIAAVNANGIVTMKGIGSCEVVAYDAVSGVIAFQEIRITSSISSASIKETKVNAGSNARINLTSFEFKNGTKKIPVNYGTMSIVSADTSSKNIEIINVDGNGIDIYALKPGNADIAVEITDSMGKIVSATARIKIADVPQVKSAKAVNVYDGGIAGAGEIRFSYDEKSANSFLVTIKDAKSQMLVTKVLDMFNPYTKTGEVCIEYKVNSSTGLSVYKYHYFNIGDVTQQLKRLAAYTITITPFTKEDNDICAKKPATLKIKTTNIPASYEHIESDEKEGGEVIRVDNEIPLSMVSCFASGNTYTLTVDANPTAEIRKSDTLTWKSSNSSVVTVKANSGTYSATMNANKAGNATISVTSKITKKVIAKWKVRVIPVGKGDEYYGTYEELFSYCSNRTDIPVLSELGTYYFVGEDGDYELVKFTAAKSGNYSFTQNAIAFADENISYTKIDAGDLGTLEAGETVYFALYGGSVENTVANHYDVVVAETEYTVNALNYNKTHRFTALYDGLYLVTYSDAADSKSTQTIDEANTRAYYIRKGESIGIYLPSRAIDDNKAASYTFKVTTPAALPAEEVVIKDGRTQYFKYVPEETGVYSFKLTNGKYKDANGSDADCNVIAYYGIDAFPGYVISAGAEYNLTKGRPVYLRLEAPQITVKEAKVEQKATLAVEKKSVTVESNGSAVAVTANMTAVSEIKVENPDKTHFIKYSVLEKDSDNKITMSPESVIIRHSDGSISDITHSSTVDTDNGVITVYSNKLKKNDVIEVAFKNSSDVKISVIAEEMGELEAKVGDTAITKATERTTVSVIVDKTGWYDIRTSSTKGVITSISEQRRLVAGVPYNKEITVTADESGAVDAKITVTGFKVLNIGDSEAFTGKVDAEKYYQINNAGSYDWQYVIEENNNVSLNLLNYSYSYSGYYVSSVGSEIADKSNGFSDTYVLVRAKAKADDANIRFKTKSTQVKTQKIYDDVAFNIPANDRVSYAFIADEDGYYTTRVVDESGKDLVLNTDYSITGLMDEERCDSGESVSITIRNLKDSGELKGKLVIEKIAESTIEAFPANGFSLEAGKSVWYKFTVDESNHYRLSFNKDAVSATYKDTNFLSYGFDFNSTDRWCKVNNTYYIKVTNPTIEKIEGIVFTVAAITVTPLELDKASGDEIEQNDTKWYSFTAPDDGYYSVSYANTFEVYRRYDGQNGTNSINNTIYLEKGDIFKLSAYNTGAKASASVKVAKANVTELKLGEEATIKPAEGETYGYAVFTSNASNAIYEIKTKSTEEDAVETYSYRNNLSINTKQLLSYNKETKVTVTRVEPVVITVNQETELDVLYTPSSAKRTYYKAIIPENGRYQVVVDGKYSSYSNYSSGYELINYVTAADKDTTKVAVTLKKIEPIKIKVGDNVKEEVVAANQTIVVEFAASNTGLYLVYSEVKSYQEDGVTFDKWIPSGYSPTVIDQSSWGTGGTTYTRLFTPSVDTKYIITPIEPTELTIGVETSLSVSQGRRTYYSYIVSEAGVYDILEDGASKFSEPFVYTESDVNKIIRRYVEGPDDSTTEIKVLLKKYTAEEVNLGDVTVKPGRHYFQYTVPSDVEGQQITVTVPTGCSAHISNDTYSTTVYSGDWQDFIVSPGEKLFILAENTSESDVQINLAAVETVVIGMGRTVSFMATAEKQSCVYSFAAPKSGTYRFVVDDYAGAEHGLDVGDVITVVCDPELGQTSTVRVEYLKYDIIQSELIALGEGKDRLIIFTAPEDGTYRFYSKGNDDTQVKLYRDYDCTDLIDEDDDSGNSQNYYIIHEMSADETIYVKVFGFNYNAAQFTNYIAKEVWSTSID